MPAAPSIAPRATPTVPAASAAHAIGPQPHAPIDIARLRRPKRRIRTTILTTTVVGLFIGLLITGGVLAWRAIDDNSADEAAATSTTPTAAPDSTIVGASPTTPQLQVAGADWQEFSHPPFTVRIPPSAVTETDESGTTYTANDQMLIVWISPYGTNATGAEEQVFRDSMTKIASEMGTPMATIGPLNSLGRAYSAVFDNGDGTWLHVRTLFLAGTMLTVMGQGGATVPSAVTVAWSGIVYGGVVATGA